MHNGTQESTLAHDIKTQADILLDTAKERVEEIDEEIRHLKRLEAERSLLLQQIEHLEGILQTEPKVVYVKTERTVTPARGRRVTEDGRTITEHIEEIMEEVFPKPLHWRGIHERLKVRGIGTEWKSPSASIRVAITKSENIKQLPSGEYLWKRDVLAEMEAAATREDQTA